MHDGGPNEFHPALTEFFGKVFCQRRGRRHDGMLAREFRRFCPKPLIVTSELRLDFKKGLSIADRSKQFSAMAYKACILHEGRNFC